MIANLRQLFFFVVQNYRSGRYQSASGGKLCAYYVTGKMEGCNNATGNKSACATIWVEYYYKFGWIITGVREVVEAGLGIVISFVDFCGVYYC
jgi:hypothetical protein